MRVRDARSFDPFTSGGNVVPIAHGAAGDRARRTVTNHPRVASHAENAGSFPVAPSLQTFQVSVGVAGASASVVNPQTTVVSTRATACQIEKRVLSYES